MHHPESVLENDTYHTKKKELDTHNKKKKRICIIVNFAVPADHSIKLKECEKKDKYLDLARELKKTMEYEGDNNTNRDWCFRFSNWTIIKGTGGLGCWMTSGDHPNYSIIENGQNT